MNLGDINSQTIAHEKGKSSKEEFLLLEEEMCAGQVTPFLEDP